MDGLSTPSLLKVIFLIPNDFIERSVAILGNLYPDEPMYSFVVSDGNSPSGKS